MKVEITIIEFDAGKYKENLKSKETFTSDPEGIGGNNGTDSKNDDANKPVRS